MQALYVADCQSHHQVHENNAGQYDEEQEYHPGGDGETEHAAVFRREEVGILELPHHHHSGLDEGAPGIVKLRIVVELDCKAQGEADHEADERE